jgi:Rha family phage regulatory protein
MTYPFISESEFPQPPLIGTVADIVVTTSLEIARYFGKRHDNILRDIRNLQLSDSFRNLNYQEAQYTPDGQTRSYPMYYVTKDGFSLLAAASFHEPDALPKKEVYIIAFNEIAARLQALSEENDADLPKMPQVNIVNGVVVTTSLAIAEYFDKLHKNVLQSIKEVDCSEEFGQLNFQPSSYLNQQGKQQPMYHITRDGFVFLVMGFTGKEAARIKEAYIGAFNQMEAELRKTTSPLPKSATPDLLDKYVALQEEHIALQKKLLQVYQSAAAEPQKNPRRHRLTDEIIQEILELYQQGFSQTEIARKVGYSTATISLVVRQRKTH